MFDRRVGIDYGISISKHNYIFFFTADEEILSILDIPEFEIGYGTHGQRRCNAVMVKVFRKH